MVVRRACTGCGSSVDAAELESAISLRYLTWVLVRLSTGGVARAEDLLAEARAAAARTRGDSATEAAIFGPRVVALVDHTVRAGDPERALHRASMMPSRTQAPAFWEAGNCVRLAAASVEVRQDARAVSYLSRARDLAPDWVRLQPLGPATMRRLVDRAPRRRGAEFSTLAAHYGVV